MLYVCFTILVLLGAPGRALPDRLPAEDYYRSVLGRMAALPQPALVSYAVLVRASGATFYVSRAPESGEAEFGFSIGSALGDTNQSWPALVRTDDGTTSVRLGDAFAVTRFPALNATWSGIDSWMRFGMQERPTPTPSPSQTPLGTASPNATQPRVIAVVRSLGLAIYGVSEGGDTTCEDGAPARLLHLRARDNYSRHPATDVTVEAATNTICTIRFQIERSDLVARDGYVELHMKPVDSYYVVTRGEISFVAGRHFGGQRVRLFIDYVGIAFPRVAPPNAFVTPSPAPDELRDP